MTTRANRGLVTAAAVLAAFGLLLGSGVFRRRVEDGFGGALRADVTLLTPSAPGFAVWMPVYAGLAAFVVWLWVGDHASRPRIRAASGPVALTLALTGLWLTVVQLNQASATGVWLSVAVMFVLELSLFGTLRKLDGQAPADRVEAVLVDGVFGLYFGWATVAVIANVAAALVVQGVSVASVSAQRAAVAVIAGAALLGVVFLLRLGRRLSIAVGLAWGLVWIGVGRFTSDLRSPVVGSCALGAAILVVAAAVWLRLARREADVPSPEIVKE